MTDRRAASSTMLPGREPFELTPEELTARHQRPAPVPTRRPVPMTTTRPYVTSTGIRKRTGTVRRYIIVDRTDGTIERRTDDPIVARNIAAGSVRLEVIDLDAGRWITAGTTAADRQARIDAALAERDRRRAARAADARTTDPTDPAYVTDSARRALARRQIAAGRTLDAYRAEHPRLNDAELATLAIRDLAAYVAGPHDLDAIISSARAMHDDATAAAWPPADPMAPPE